MTDSRLDHCARALAEHEGNERVFMAEGHSEVARRAADDYRTSARIVLTAAIRETQSKGPASLVTTGATAHKE